jgi:hypothetical protein
MISDDDRNAILSQEDLVAEILKRRSERPKPWWESTGIVTSATAILTVLVTSVAGYYAQKSLRERENNFTEMQGRTQLAREAARQAYSAMAGMLKINEERLKFSRGELDFLNDSMKIALARNTNRIQQDWRIQREEAGWALYLAFDSISGVPAAWQKMRDVIETETVCLENAYVAHENKKSVLKCDEEIAARAAAGAELRARLKTGYDQGRRLD